MVYATGDWGIRYGLRNRNFRHAIWSRTFVGRHVTLEAFLKISESSNTTEWNNKMHIL